MFTSILHILYAQIDVWLAAKYHIIANYYLCYQTIFLRDESIHSDLGRLNLLLIVWENRLIVNVKAKQFLSFQPTFNIFRL